MIAPGVDARFASIGRRPDAAPFALVAGTVERRKNLLRAVETIAAIPGLRLYSAGPPTPYAAEVRARAAELGVGDRVTLLGYVPRATLDDLYARAALALVPSHYEGFGYAVAEARCAGLPFVAARTSALVEVAGGAGALVDPADADGWVAAVRAVLADRAAAQARADADRPGALARFGWRTAASALCEVYRRAADVRGRS